MFCSVALLSLAMTIVSHPGDEHWFQEPAAPGKSIGLTRADLQTVTSFRANDPIIGTYLFYWYDAKSKAHLLDSDGTDACTTHPVSWDDYSYQSARWWREQLTDIRSAGIDFAAPVYWGCPDDHGAWSFQGLPHLVEACDSMQAAKEKYPKVALFYDTSTLQFNKSGRRVDLTTDDGKAWFYCTIRDFWSFIPPRHWAAIDGRPIVLLYAVDFATKQDATLFPYVRTRFQKDFGVDPYIIKQTSWAGEADNTCNWGGALGLSLAGCAALGPGYDHSAVPGRTPLVKDREGGAFYRRSWETLLRYKPARRPRLVMVETWNEFHEGTDVAHSREYGRQYIDLTSQFADMFHANAVTTGISGPYQNAKSVSSTFGAEGKDGGITVASGGDGNTKAAVVAGRSCVQSAPSEHAGKFIYFQLDDSFVFDIEPQAMSVVVEYYDDGPASFALEYDSSDARGSVREGAFKHGGSVQLGNTHTWKRATVSLTDARFGNRCNGSDFRLAVQGAGELSVAAVEVARMEVARTR
jgi:hypothetical protein